MAVHRRRQTGPFSLLPAVVLAGGLLLSGAAMAFSVKPPSMPHGDSGHRDDPPPNDACSDALPIVEGSTPFDTGDADTDGPPHSVCQFDGQVYNDIWFRTTAPLSGMLWLTLCDSNFDTDVAVYDGWQCPVDDSRLLGCNDDGCPGSGPARYRSRLVLPVEQGQDLLLRVGGYGPWDSGHGQLELEWEASVEGCPLAGELDGSGLLTASTSGAWQTGSATCGYSNWSPARVYRLLPDCSGSWQAGLCGSGFDTVLSVHTGCPPTTANQLVCNDDACGLMSEVQFTAQADSAVYLRVSGYNGALGDFQLLLSGPGCTLPAPPNDACAAALPLADGWQPVCTLQADTDGPDQPGGCGGAADPSIQGDVWFTYAAPCAGMAGFDLCDADWDSRLALYPGGTCPPDPASLLACSDDDCGLASRLEVPVTQGETYLLRVGGVQGARGSGLLGVACKDTCTVTGLGAPLLQITLVDSLASLHWSPVTESLDGCVVKDVEYCVWRRLEEGPWELLDCQPDTSWTDLWTGNITGVCRYRVTARLP